MKRYNVFLTSDARDDIKNIKLYIIKTFRYQEYANNFSRKIRAAVNSLDIAATGHRKTGFVYESHVIYYKSSDTYLIFYFITDNSVIVIRVLKDRMYWQSTLSRMKDIKILY